jgi:hypothetical protein
MSDAPAGIIIRKRGPKPVAEDALRLLKGHLAKRGFAQVELVTRWREIAGAALAAHCFPQKLASGANGSLILTLVADDRASLELQHQAPKLIDRINRYFGREAVSKIKVVAGDIPKRLGRPALRPLTAAEESELEALTAGVQDGALRDALQRLGRCALAESRKSPLSRR